MKKRILPALLALCMVMALLPATVFATITPENGKCQCTDESCSHTGASSGTACTATELNNDGLCSTCAPAVTITPENGKCQCTDTSCSHTGASSGTACTATELNNDNLCSTCAPTDSEPEPDPEPEVEQVTYTIATWTIEDVSCTCLKNHGENNVHEAEAEEGVVGQSATPCTNTTDIEMKGVTYEFDKEPVQGETDPDETDEAFATRHAAWESDKATAENEAKATATSEATAAFICDTCKAQQTSACTGKEDCDPELKAHKKDCLSQCKMGPTCKNSVGVASAHKVTYTLKYKLTTYTRTDGVVTSATGAEVTVGDLADYAAVQAKLNAIVTITEVEAPNDDEADGVVRKTATYTVTAVHCDMAKAADDVTLGTVEDGDEATEPTDPTTPDEEVKAPTKAEEFDDLKGDEWYAEELTALIEKGVFTGSLDDGKYSFNATGEVTGAELVVLLSRVAGEDLVTTGSGWNLAATAWASEAGYTEGLEINTTGKLTRKDVILVLWRAAGKPESEQELSFTDAEGLEGDYLTAMKWAVEKKIIGGYEDNTVKPDGNITRAEMVTVLTRYDDAK